MTINPFEDPDAWDGVTIAVARSGNSNVYRWENLPVDFDGDVVNDWDVKKAKGADGARATDNGYEAAQFSMKWLLWKSEHFRTYELFVADAKPRAGKEAKPILTIVHPMLAMFGLMVCNLKKCRFPDFKEVDQWEAKVDLVEWSPSPKPVKKATNTGVITLPETTIVGRRMTSFQRDRPASNGTVYVAPPPLPSQDVRPSMVK